MGTEEVQVPGLPASPASVLEVGLLVQAQIGNKDEPRSGNEQVRSGRRGGGGKEDGGSWGCEDAHRLGVQ